MEVLVKILYLLSLSSATISLQLLPSVNVKGPFGLDLSFDGLHANIKNNNEINSNKLVRPDEKCYCIPSNANSPSVTSNFAASNEKIQRLVVYLYKSNGSMKMYVPNKFKQELIPELNFDENDILKTVSSESIVEVFNWIVFNQQETVVSVSQDVVKETEISNVVNNNKEQPNVISGTEEMVIGNTEYLPVVPSNGDILSVEGNPVHIEGEIVSINNVPSPLNQNQDSAITSSSQTISTSSEIVSTSQSKPEEIINEITIIDGQNSKPEDVISHVTVIDGQDLNINPNLVDSNQQQQISSISNILIPDGQDKYKKITWDNIVNSDDFNSILQIITPENSQSLANILLQQNQHNPEFTIKPYIPFNDWFDIQLKRVVLYNLETEAKIVEFRNKIQKILQNNGINVSSKGIVTDSNHKLVRMNNLMLRPILIGSPIDAQTLLHASHGSDAGVLYLQMIEVILVSPPKLLGTLVMGTVYLPRSMIKTLNVKTMKGNKKDIFGKGDCVSCNLNFPRNSHSRVTYPFNVLHYPTVSKPYQTYQPYNPYYPVPYRPTVLQNGLPYIERNNADMEAGNQGRAGIFETIVDTLSPILFAPSRRLLGGRVPQGAKPGPRTYPNDVPPGFRIIGGNAATSSGTPLTVKGRSGFENPSYPSIHPVM